ncbi:MAG: hypothetical protein LRY69_01625 [Gammaproteobacteria bacterium]|nr:hypothetical protein [Gammaproteobacteria bacterium]
MVDLTVLQKKFLRQQGESRSKRVLNIPALRGTIEDRNHRSLAISSPVSSLWVNPQEFMLTHENVNKIATLLRMPEAHLYQQIEIHKKKSFMYIKRELPPDIAAAVSTLGLSGLYLQQEYKRFLPRWRGDSPVSWIYKY